jgi:polyketide biosynthesis acyl carrier protein
MTKKDVLAVIERVVLDVLPEATPHALASNLRLTDLGANSVEVAEVAVNAMMELRIKVPPTELHAAESLEALAEVLYQHLPPSDRH